jgi:hypothetical protein
VLGLAILESRFDQSARSDTYLNMSAGNGHTSQEAAGDTFSDQSIMNM